MRRERCGCADPLEPPPGPLFRLAGVILLLPGLVGHGCVEPTPQVVDARLLEKGRETYKLYCLECHQSDGSGVSELIPTLVHTDWVSGDTPRLIRLVLEGLEGPIVVNGGRFSGVMGAFDCLSDEEVAALLTYLRQTFGNQAPPVAPNEVAQVRSQQEVAASKGGSDPE